MSDKVNYSALSPGGEEALLISDLFWGLLLAATIIWLIFVALQYFAVKTSPPEDAHGKTRLLVIGGGVLFPVLVISVSIYFTLKPIPRLLRKAPPGSLTVHVSGLQWWWRVRYEVDGKLIETANEIRLPVNRPVNFLLKSEDVIHSFWIPSLAGKMDMIPGRETFLSLTPTKKGDFIGNCAEYCGAAHALMRLQVKVVEEKEFKVWLKNLSSPYEGTAHRGEKVFLTSGCASCHSVRGLAESGRVGPDLTLFGERNRIGAAVFKNENAILSKWITHPEKLKPEVKMPSFDTLPKEERKALVEWLGSLR